MASLAGSNRPASPADRRDAIAQAWRDEPGITNTALAERFGVSGRTVQRDTQALQERGIQRRPPDRRRRSHRTRAQYAAIYRRFLAWLAARALTPGVADAVWAHHDPLGPSPASSTAGQGRNWCLWRRTG